MPTTPFAEEHDALRSTVRRLVTDRLAPLAAAAEQGEAVHASALQLSADLRGLPDVLADVVAAEELGRLRSGGLVAVLLDAALLADVGVTDGPAAVARHSAVTVHRATATGSASSVIGGVFAEHLLALDAGVVVDARAGCVAEAAQSPHGLRGAAVADLVLRDAPCREVEVNAEVLRRAELREAAAAVAAGWLVFDDAQAYAKQRTAFGRPIGTFQVNRHALAEMATWLTAAEALVHDTAWAMASEGDAAPAATATARLVAGRTARRVADMGLQLHGGYGYTMDFDVQRAWRDARALAIGDADRRALLAQGRGGHA